MEIALTPIEGSTYLAAAGYAAESRIIRIRFHDGAERDFPDQPPEMYAALLVAPSKGRFLAALSAPAPAVPPPAAGPLDMYDQDECCNPGLARALRKGSAGQLWACPKCGTEWKPEAADTGRRWRPSTWFAVFR